MGGKGLDSVFDTLKFEGFNYIFLFLLATVVTSLSEFKQVGENSIMMALLMLFEVSIVR